MTVLIKPIISEKAGLLASQGKYVFEVRKSANAVEVKKDVEKSYKVQVAAVNLVNLPAKVRRSGRQVGRTSARKKAYVTLVPGQTISGITEPA